MSNGWSGKEPLMKAECVTKSFPMGDGHLDVLKGIDFEIREKDAVCILGASGAGKSTLLHILGTLDRPTLGKVFFRDQDLGKMSDDQLAHFRNQNMGFVFQFHHLLAEFTSLENVMMPHRIAGKSEREAREKSEQLLVELGLQERMTHYPSELSGGEKQRVAIARALVREPQILFADEPTGNLDSSNAEHIQQLFFDLRQKMGLTLVVVTHDKGFAGAFPVRRQIVDGHWHHD